MTVLKHRMHEREYRMWQVRVGGSGGMLPREIFEKSVQLGGSGWEGLVFTIH